jgi:hypothetical protein
MTIPATEPHLMHQAAEDVFRTPLPVPLERLRHQQRAKMRSKYPIRTRISATRTRNHRQSQSRHHSKSPSKYGSPDRQPNGKKPSQMTCDAVEMGKGARRTGRREFQSKSKYDHTENQVQSPGNSDRLLPIDIVTPAVGGKPSEYVGLRNPENGIRRVSANRDAPTKGDQDIVDTRFIKRRHSPKAQCDVPASPAQVGPDPSSSAPPNKARMAFKQPQNPPRMSRGKRFGIADLALCEGVKRSLAQQSRASSQSLPPELPSPVPPIRTSSQNRAIDRFTKQLEKFAESAAVSRKLPVSTPTIETPMSLETISALLPYQAEFQAAGLAVTSKQQKSHSTKWAIPKHLTLPTYEEPAIGSLHLDGGKESSSSSSSSSSSGTEVAFAGKTADWEIYMIDELPPAKDRKSSRICKLPCFKDDEGSLPGSEKLSQNDELPPESGPDRSTRKLRGNASQILLVVVTII